MLEVYLDPCTVNSRKVLAGLSLLNVEFKFHFIDYFAGAHKSPEYKAINPCGTVPAATDGDLVLTESNAILQYAADLSSDSSAYPQDLKKRADINRWLLWETSAWFPSCYVYLVEYVVKPLLQAEPSASVIEEQAPRWLHLANILNDRLSKGRWLTGDTISIADIAVAAPMHLHAAQRLPLDQTPHLKRWIADIEQLPCWQETQGAVDKALLPEKKAATNGANSVIVANGDTNGTTVNGHKDVRALFNYTKDVKQLTELYFYESDAAKHIHEPGDDPREMSVHDGWHRASTFSVDKEGFSLHDFTTPFSDWDDDTAVAKDFYPSIVDFLKRTQGASHVLVFDHTIRSRTNAAKKITQETGTSQRAPVMLVHCDYTADSGPARVRQLLSEEEAATLLSRRVAFFNVWKPIRRVVEEHPLAMCDVTSSPPEDFFKLHLRYRDRNGENYVMRYSPEHKWWYFPRMTSEQVVLLKTFDSEVDGRARFVGHSAFHDPTSPADVPYRESVEVRTIAFF
ncbi:glutathione S-transferase, partial [Lecanoromycetidae sp. Uapishka_2]